MRRPCPTCSARQWDRIEIRGRERAVCLACFSAWWVEGGRLVGTTRELFTESDTDR